jgi:hypothetical protein
VDNVCTTQPEPGTVSEMTATTRFDASRPFNRAAARQAGLSVRQLGGAAYQRIFYDIYIASAIVVTAAIRGVAALSVTPPGSHVSHHTAAELWGGCPPADPNTHVSVPGPGWRSQRRGISAHVANPKAEVAKLRGLALSSPTQAFLDLAAVAPLVDLVVLGDSLVKAERTTPKELVAAADAWAGHGARRARRAARLVREGVDSVMESRLRMLIVLGGLPEPTVNHIVRDDNGGWVRRYDLCYLRLKVLVEYDGRQHAEDEDQWHSDISRREGLDGEQWRLIVVVAADIYKHPDQTLRRIVVVLRQRGVQGLPSRFPAECQRHFPGQGNNVWRQG